MKKILALILITSAACSQAPEIETTTQPDSHAATFFIQHATTHHFVQKDAFQQIGILYDSQTPLEYRTDNDWLKAPITFSEKNMRVALIKLDKPTYEIEFRSTRPFLNAQFEFHENIIAPFVTKEDTDLQKNKAQRTKIKQALAPASMVISRRKWGARNPDKKCGTPHTPKNITIHHTGVPDSDGPDPAVRLRQMQAYHIDTRGWCDIGYHFIVSKSGKIYQGISSEERSGIHVGNNNYENVGISLIGNFEKQRLIEPQRGATAKILGWVANTYNIPFTRPSVRGHREWKGASTDCPGKHTLNILDELIFEAKASIEGPRKPCTMLGKQGGEIDDTSDCFQLFGPAKSWRSETTGFKGTLHWTNMFKSTTPQNYARWNVNLEHSGTYKIEFYSVPKYALYQSVTYSVAHKGSETQITIDQSVASEGWNVLGELEFSRGDNQWVEVHDSTPFEVAKNQHVVSDAIRLTRINAENNNNPNNQNTNNKPTHTTHTAPISPNNQNPIQGSNNLNPQNPPAPMIETKDGFWCTTTHRSSRPTFLLIIGMLAIFFRRKQKSSQ